MSDAALPDWSLTDGELRRAGSVKWTLLPPPVLPAWVAEMDVAPCPAVAAALAEGLRDGAFGYPAIDAVNGVPEATAEFQQQRFGWRIDPADVITCGDVMAGVRLVLDTLCEPGGVVVPLPSYPPFLDVVPLTGRRLVGVPTATGVAGRPELDLERIDAALAAGARTVLLANPHNPLGRVFTAAELGGLRDVAVRHGARVISDEIHAPLLLPAAGDATGDATGDAAGDGAGGGAPRHVPYASLPGAAEHTTTVTAASKGWNLPGLKCAQIIAGTPAETARLRAVPVVANHGVSPLGLRATVAAYRHGTAWLDAVLRHLAQRRRQFGELLAERAPQLAWVPMEATYLAWVDARSTGLADPGATAIRDGEVFVQSGRLFDPTGAHDGFVRVNLATSAERLDRVVAGLAKAWGGAG